LQKQRSIDMPELVILAAGMGSRYGGLKQIDPVGPHDEILLDYSVYDAVQAGFSRVVFVIRREIETAFRNSVGNRYERHIPCEYVHQELHHLPPGIAVPPDRKKPWGTGHALWVCEATVNGPFAVINADDLYGRNAYQQISDFLAREDAAMSGADYGMVGFALENTLSEHGSVSRGICVLDGEGYLKSITERTEIKRDGNRIRYLDETGTWRALAGKELTSMNFWGFTPRIFPHLREQFLAFLMAGADDPRSEFYLPEAVGHLLDAGKVLVSVLPSRDKWTGVTNPGDKLPVRRHLEELTKQGVYPDKLWER